MQQSNYLSTNLDQNKLSKICKDHTSDTVEQTSNAVILVQFHSSPGAGEWLSALLTDTSAGWMFADSLHLNVLQLLRECHLKNRTSCGNSAV